jgi:hypothetical protein
VLTAATHTHRCIARVTKRVTVWRWGGLYLAVTSKVPLNGSLHVLPASASAFAKPQPSPASPPLKGHISASGFCTNPSTSALNFGHQSISPAQARLWRRPLARLENQHLQPPTSNLKTDNPSDSTDPNGHWAGHDRQCMDSEAVSQKQTAFDASRNRLDFPAALADSSSTAFQGTTEAIYFSPNRLVCLPLALSRSRRCRRASLASSAPSWRPGHRARIGLGDLDLTTTIMIATSKLPF